MNPDSRYRPPYPSKSPTPTREFEASGSTRSQLYLDDETLHRMIESFGPLEYSQFATTINPQEAYGPFVEQDPFNAAAWAPQELTRRKAKSPRADTSATSHQHSYLLGQSQTSLDETNPQTAEARKETLIEWFDRSVEKELQKRRDTSNSPATSSIADPALAPLKTRHALNISKGTAERMAEASASRVEIGARLETDFTTELTDAVEKFAKAETMAQYTEALEAAEQAAQNAPPEMVEQAAAAGARRVQVQMSRVKETVPGARPIEVVGYVGVTKPHIPKKST